MNKNIKTVFENQVKKYEFQSTDDMKLPSFVFDVYEDAELALSALKSMKAHGIDYWNAQFEIKYVFRVLGIKNNWN